MLYLFSCCDASSLSIHPQNDEEAERTKDQQFLEQISELEDEFLKEYRLKRIEEMRRAVENMYVFVACSLNI